MRIVIFFAFVIFGILSCTRVLDEVAYHREYSFEEKSYYLNGNAEYKKLWNINPDDDGFVDGCSIPNPNQRI